MLLRWVSPAGPGRFMRFFYRQPVYLYRFGLGGLVGSSTLLLVTKGRKTGKPRPTPLSYQFDAAHGRYVVTSGWAERSQWYRNLLADPQVHVRVGRKRFCARGEVAPLEEAIEVHRAYIARNPRQARSLPHLTGVPFDGSEEALHEAARRCPVIYLIPQP